MKKQTGYVLQDSKVFIGLEDSKKTWKLCVRSGGIAIAETAMPAQYEVLHNYCQGWAIKGSVSIRL